MTTVQEAAEAFANDLKTLNIMGIMVALTPEAIGKAMAMQGQLAARAAEAQAAGRTPAPITGYGVTLKGQDGEDQIALIAMESADGAAEITTRWREIDGAWKVNDLDLTSLTNADGSPAPAG